MNPIRKELMNFSDKELETEIEWRKKQKKMRPVPQPLENIDWYEVILDAQDYLKYCASDEWHEDTDYASSMLEIVLQTVFGDNIWDWISDVVKEK